MSVVDIRINGDPASVMKKPEERASRWFFVNELSRCLGCESDRELPSIVELSEAVPAYVDALFL